MASSASIAERRRRHLNSRGGDGIPGKMITSSSDSRRTNDVAPSAVRSRASLMRNKLFEQSKVVPVRNTSLPKRPSPPAPIPREPRRSVSISDCLTALNERQQTSASNRSVQHANSGSDSVGDMPSLVSYGHASTFSKQSCSSSAGSTFTISSGSVDLSLLSSASPNSVVTSSTIASSIRKASGDSLGATTMPRPPEDSSSSPIQILRVKTNNAPSAASVNNRLSKARDLKEQQQPRPLLKIKNYKPDELPRRELRWKTEEPSAEPPISVMRWSRRSER